MSDIVLNKIQKRWNVCDDIIGIISKHVQNEYLKTREMYFKKFPGIVSFNNSFSGFLEKKNFINLTTDLNARQLRKGNIRTCINCSRCFRKKSSNNKYKKCPCGKVIYCYEYCQKEDWKRHKLCCNFKK